ncbi:hypothetical protein Mgra_00004322 [Meloidogyne graminicola]|uniref:Uncharacterized protein n=1 Tax=Meloidogyne graminicola TaxID=189291 RepID=A0A8S9ZT25_9BILA|nr:hypothetical protein Mgra_00004322 [Meloidogyne graminicola]
MFSLLCNFFIQKMIFLIFSIIGFILFLYIIVSIIFAIYRILFPFYYPFPKNLKSLAGTNWALITGGTDGIGREYVNELAKRNFNIVIISRTKSRLDKVASEELRSEQFPFDFTNPKVEDYEKNIFNKIDDIDIGILVNNVGIFHEYPERFDKSEGGINKLIDMGFLINKGDIDKYNFIYILNI